MPAVKENTQRWREVTPLLLLAYFVSLFRAQVSVNCTSHVRLDSRVEVEENVKDHGV